MFSFFKKRKIVEAPALHVDIHSHLIPGIDDGSQSMDESIVLLKKLEILGYKKVITTPHIMTDAYRNTPQIVRTGLTALQKEAKEQGITLEIEAAAEYYLDEGFSAHLHGENVLSIANKYILFETSYVSKPMQMEEMIFEISSMGYTPLLAHPERYRYVQNMQEEYGRWKSLGVEFQINLNSLVGHYGKSAKQKAAFLSEAGMIDFLGSDTHNEKHVSGLETVFASKQYANVFVHNTIKNNTLGERK